MMSNRPNNEIREYKKHRCDHVNKPEATARTRNKQIRSVMSLCTAELYCNHDEETYNYTNKSNFYIRHTNTHETVLELPGWRISSLNIFTPSRVLQKNFLIMGGQEWSILHLFNCGGHSFFSNNSSTDMTDK